MNPAQNIATYIKSVHSIASLPWEFYVGIVVMIALLFLYFELKSWFTKTMTGIFFFFALGITAFIAYISLWG